MAVPEVVVSVLRGGGGAGNWVGGGGAGTVRRGGGGGAALLAKGVFRIGRGGGAGIPFLSDLCATAYWWSFLTFPWFGTCTQIMHGI